MTWADWAMALPTLLGASLVGLPALSRRTHTLDCGRARGVRPKQRWEEGACQGGSGRA
jgi:hypothetical protein